MVPGVSLCLCVMLSGVAEPSLELLLKRHQNALASVERFAVKGRYYRDATLADPEAEFLWAREGRRVRFQWRYLSRSTSTASVFDRFTDGHKFFSLIIEGMTDVPKTIGKEKLRISGSIEPLALGASFLNHEPMALRAFSIPRKGDAPLDLTCKELLRRGKNIQVHPEKSGRYKVHGTLPLGPKEGSITFSLWFNKKLDYLVDEFIVEKPNGAKSSIIRTVARDFVRRNGALWPGRVAKMMTMKNGPEQTDEAITFVFSEVLLNEPVPEKFFDFRFPKGLAVDETGESGELVRVHLYGENNQVARSFTPKEYEEYLRRKRGLPPGPQPPQKPALWPVVATLGLLVLAGGLALWWRRAAGAAPTGEESTGN